MWASERGWSYSKDEMERIVRSDVWLVNLLYTIEHQAQKPTTKTSKKLYNLPVLLPTHKWILRVRDGWERWNNRGGSESEERRITWIHFLCMHTILC